MLSGSSAASCCWLPAAIREHRPLLRPAQTCICCEGFPRWVQRAEAQSHTFEGFCGSKSSDWVLMRGKKLSWTARGHDLGAGQHARINLLGYVKTVMMSKQSRAP